LQYVAGPEQIELSHYQQAFALLLVFVAVAIALTFFLTETGAMATTHQLKRAA